MDPERPSDRRKAHQSVNEVRKLLGEDPKLVDHDGDSRQSGNLGATKSGLAVLLHAGHPRPRQQPLTPTKLGGQRGERSRGQVPVQVGDDPHDMGKLRAPLEPGAALVVNEQDVHLVRAVPQG